MTMTAVWLKVDEQRFVPSLQDAGGKLDSVEDEVVLDFSSVLRIDPSAIRAMEEFATIADDKGVKIVLRGVSTSIYKVLKLVKLASRFAFTD
ncbi:MAG TPA: STAS domain-containing protein [Candidatus Acidoferrum sp.]